jgi:hypothetical protein
MVSRLYEDAVPTEDATPSESILGPINIEETPSGDPEQWWPNTVMPTAWLFKARGRAGLVEYALRAIHDGMMYAQNKSELSDNASVSRHSVIRYIDDLVALGIYEEHGNKRSRYKPNEDSRVLAAIDAANDELTTVEHVPE